MKKNEHLPLNIRIKIPLLLLVRALYLFLTVSLIYSCSKPPDNEISKNEIANQTRAQIAKTLKGNSFKWTKITDSTGSELLYSKYKCTTADVYEFSGPYDMFIRQRRNHCSNDTSDIQSVWSMHTYVDGRISMYFPIPQPFDTSVAQGVGYSLVAFFFRDTTMNTFDIDSAGKLTMILKLADQGETFYLSTDR